MVCTNSCPLKSNSNKAIQTTYYTKDISINNAHLYLKKNCVVNTFYGTLEL